MGYRSKYGINEDIQHRELAPLLLNNIEEIYADGILKLHKDCVASVVKYRSVIALMDAFYSDMHCNNQKDTKLHHAKLRRQLKETGFVR